MGPPEGGRAVSTQPQPDIPLADHDETMKALRKRLENDQKALAEAEEWGRSRERRLPILRRFVALLGRHGIIWHGMHRVDRNFVVAQCYAIATGHGLGMMGYTYLDSQSGPLATLLDIDLYAVELDGKDHGAVFRDDADEREFLERVKGKGHDELGRMARDAVIPERERMTIA